MTNKHGYPTPEWPSLKLQISNTLWSLEIKHGNGQSSISRFFEPPLKKGIFQPAMFIMFDDQRVYLLVEEPEQPYNRTSSMKPHALALPKSKVAMIAAVDIPTTCTGTSLMDLKYWIMHREILHLADETLGVPVGLRLWTHWTHGYLEMRTPDFCNFQIHNSIHFCRISFDLSLPMYLSIAGWSGVFIYWKITSQQLKRAPHTITEPPSTIVSRFTSYHRSLSLYPAVIYIDRDGKRAMNVDCFQIGNQSVSTLIRWLPRE